jgi:hypothetical protein
MADVSRAVEEIARIHTHLASREIFHGWRAIPVATSGLIGLTAALVLSTATAPVDAWDFVRTWLVVALLALSAGCAEIIWRYARTASDFDRRRSRAVMRQFLPSLAAGAVLSVTLVRLDPAFVVALPGAWALTFGLAIFAASPGLPPKSTWAATYYAVAGVALLVFAPSGLPAPWTVGGVFGLGQLFAAVLVYVEAGRLTRPFDPTLEEWD